MTMMMTNDDDDVTSLPVIKNETKHNINATIRDKKARNNHMIVFLLT